MALPTFAIRAIDAVTVEVTTETSIVRATLEDIARAIRYHDREPQLREHFQAIAARAAEVCRQWRRDNER